jgi:activator of HSP90 ATPase
MNTEEGEHSMISNFLTRRDFSLGLASLVSVLGVGGTALGSGGGLAARQSAQSDGPTHNAGAIHQEVVFNASRKLVYEALTDAKQFDRVVQLSENGKSMENRATQISREVGGAFSLFGGYIVGRHIEMLVNERLVQAWRETSWLPGVYSIVKFELVEQGAATKLVFDHTGFPGSGEHLYTGWKADYWEPLRKFLG